MPQPPIPASGSTGAAYDIDSGQPLPPREGDFAASFVPLSPGGGGYGDRGLSQQPFTPGRDGLAEVEPWNDATMGDTWNQCNDAAIGLAVGQYLEPCTPIISARDGGSLGARPHGDLQAIEPETPIISPRDLLHLDIISPPVSGSRELAGSSDQDPLRLQNNGNQVHLISNVDQDAPVPEDDVSIRGTFRDDDRLSKNGDFANTSARSAPPPFAQEAGSADAVVVRDYTDVLQNQPGMESGASGATQNTDASGNTMNSGQSGMSTSSGSSWTVRLGNRVKSGRTFAAAGARKKLDSAKASIGRLRKGEVAPVDIDAKIVRKYMFKTEGREREITLAHAKFTWYLKLDAEVVASKAHSSSVFKNYSTSVNIEIVPLENVPEGCERSEPLIATLRMEWNPRNVKWIYSMLVGDTTLQPCWTKSGGLVTDFELSEIQMPFREQEDPATDI